MNLIKRIIRNIKSDYHGAFMRACVKFEREIKMLNREIEDLKKARELKIDASF